jgi:acetolactate synthase I/II/III large subunit
MTLVKDVATAMAGRELPAVFGVPGGGVSLELITELEHLGLPFVTTQSEGAAAVMAGTAGRLGSSVGVALGIKGPGLTNMVPGLAACRFESLPVIGLVEAYPPHTPPTVAHKRIDHSRVVDGVTKGYGGLAVRGPSFEEFAEYAQSEIPGPVVLDFVGEGDHEGYALNPESAPFRPEDTTAWRQVVKQASQPVMIVGTLAMRLGLHDQLDRLSFPVFSTAAAKGVVNEGKPHAAGVYTGRGGPMTPEHALLPLADAVIGIGLRPSEVLSLNGFQSPVVNFEVPTVRSEVPGAIRANTKDLGDALWYLTERGWGLDLVKEARARVRQALLERSRFLPAHVFDVLWSRFGGQNRLVVDTGSFCTVAEHTWATMAPHLYVGSGQSRYMGLGVPMALGGMILDPSVPTALAVGDGGISPFFGELLSAVERALPLVVLFMTDGGFGSIRASARQRGLTDRPLVKANPPWRKAAVALGFHDAHAEDVADVSHHLERWKPGDPPLFLECRFDPPAYQAMTEGVR